MNIIHLSLAIFTLATIVLCQDIIVNRRKPFVPRKSPTTRSTLFPKKNLGDLDAFRTTRNAHIELFSTREEINPHDGSVCVHVEADVRIGSGQIQTLKMKNRCCGNGLLSGNLTTEHCECLFTGREGRNGGLAYGDLCTGNINFVRDGNVMELVTMDYVSRHKLKAKALDPSDLLETGNCGSPNHSPLKNHTSTSTTRQSQFLTPRELEIVWALDHTYVRDFPDDEWVTRFLSTLNGVETVFREDLNIKLLSLDLRVLDRSSLTLSDNSVNVLNSYGRYVSGTGYSADVSHLLVSRNMGSTLGIAYQPGACSGLQIGLSTDRRRSLNSVVVTVAHEIGHNLNMEHINCRNCIMRATVSSGSQGFVDTSRRSYESYARSGNGKCIEEI